MQTITLIRKKAKGKAVPGTISFPIGEKTLSYPTLENADFIIPEGTYPVERTWSPRFKKLLPLIQNVPDRDGIRIHRGTLPEHSHGCILTDMGGMSYLQVLFNIIEQKNEYNDEPESAIIQISNA